MTLRSRIADLLAPRRKMSIEQWFDTFFGGASRSSTGEVINQISAMRVSAVWACVTIISEDVAKLPWHVYRKKGDGEKIVVADHPVERLLQRPNWWQNGFEFKEMMMAALLLRRNAYAAILHNFRGEPTALIPVNPDWVTLYQAPDGALFYNVARQNQHLKAALQSLPLLIPADDMLHIRGLSLNSLWGLSAITSGKDAIGLALAQQELAAVFASNGAQLSGVLQTDKKLTDQTYERLRNAWKEKRAGIKNAGETAILEQGLKFEKLGMTSVDAEFVAHRQHQVEEVGRYFRVPHHKLGIMERSTNQTMAQAEQEYFNNTVVSWCTRVEEKVGDTFGLADQDVFVEFDLARALRADILTRYQAFRLGTGGAAFLKPNEVRRVEGMPDDPDGDVLLRPANLVPIGTPVATPGAGGAVGSDQTGAPAPGGDGDQSGSTDEPGGPG